ncbi:hypothetical protein NLI96_g1565 [Meripilus lineatus]|uniref:UDP-galactose transporter n=1 Tax=Meripilus lineatus TaxID=2056292 RepID=A0AAD5YMT9_9APHY|nr:hypothetical protein NLI96_g1565 [Physisporinus lineatus]
MSQHKDLSNATHSLQLNLNIKEAEEDAYEKEELAISLDPLQAQSAAPTLCGLPLKYVSLVTLAVQNAMLTLIMHYSRISAAPSATYSAAAAVLATELLKGTVSLLIAFIRIDSYAPQYLPNGSASISWSSVFHPRFMLGRFRRLGREVFRADCWKLSIPAILYVIQNNLQFVAISNLDAATFQVSYQMKILTTAAFSVVLLRKKLTPTKWLALLFLAIGVGIVQIQTSGSKPSSSALHHDMKPLKGFLAVVMACFTSGLAGVYFEMVLKNSQGDLWVRNVQLSLFSLLPALVPIVFNNSSPTAMFSTSLFANFTVWAWATVFIQVAGGLLTAMVIKYADNILKGFATSLSIVISFLASVALFNLQMTLTFILGSTVVLVATFLYNQPETPATTIPTIDIGGNSRTCKSWSWHWRRPTLTFSRSVSAIEFSNVGGGAISRRSSTSSLNTLATPPHHSPTHSHHVPSKSYPPTPTEREGPILGQLSEKSFSRKSDHSKNRLLGVVPIPLTATKAIASKVGLFRSASFASGMNTTTMSSASNDYLYPYEDHPQPILTSSTSSYPPSLSISTRPSSAMSCHPGTRPPSVLSGSSSATLVSSSSSSILPDGSS